MSDTKKPAAAEVAAAIPQPEIPTIPEADLKAARELLARAAEAEKLKNEANPVGWGPGKPGKKACTLPEVPPHLGEVTINTNQEITKPDGTKFNAVKLIRLKGTVELTHDEYQEALYRIDRLIRQELEGRYGRGRAKSITAVFDVNQGAWVGAKADGKPVAGNAGIF